MVPHGKDKQNSSMGGTPVSGQLNALRVFSAGQEQNLVRLETLPPGEHLVSSDIFTPG